MKWLKFISRLVYLVTVFVWLLACADTYIRLVGDAAGSPEIYARTAGFQLINFVWQFLPAYLVFLVIALLIEFAVFSMLLFLARRAKAGLATGGDR